MVNLFLLWMKIFRLLFSILRVKPERRAETLMLRAGKCMRFYRARETATSCRHFMLNVFTPKVQGMVAEN